jgi:hypothetical protein
MTLHLKNYDNLLICCGCTECSHWFPWLTATRWLRSSDILLPNGLLANDKKFQGQHHDEFLGFLGSQGNVPKKGSTIKVAQKVLELDGIGLDWQIARYVIPVISRDNSIYMYIYIDTSLSLDDGNTSRCISLGQCHRRSSGRLRRWTQGA